VQLPRPHFRPMPLHYKLLSIVLIVSFVLIGIAGLILPLIPGLLFLFLAAYLLTRVSRRAAAFAHAQPWYRSHMGKLDAAGTLTTGQRVKISLLLVAKGMVAGLKSLFSVIRNVGKPSH
jgi:uncharacterized membrane protein YbaN (DUF454 family)